ncbi:MAG: DNA alkylation repair protein [Firmicutes bacterium]|nr:DNA alkylation repair protein [Bacillota bacterium]MCL2256429.1 DNA alkylation repair protein [Bacillota bacterium]
MAEPMKNLINLEVIKEVAEAIKSVHNDFDAAGFVRETINESWNSLELMQRCRAVCERFKEYLPKDYETAIKILMQAIGKIKEGFVMESFTLYVANYGLDEKYWNISMSALALFTKHFTSEFAVRPFIIKHEERMMSQMREWSKSDNEHLRRLSSEGCRPALPWAMGLPKYKIDPSPILSILEELKEDVSLYVRKSVANNINDISKTHPELVIEIAKRWYGENEKTNWIVKHGLRTLLKKSKPEALAIFGLGDVEAIEVSNFAIKENLIKLGDSLEFSFEIKAKKMTKARLEYGVDYMKSNGKQNRKIFQISEITLKENKTKHYFKKHPLADHSTRKHYLGKHAITLIVNGLEQGSFNFELI